MADTLGRFVTNVIEFIIAGALFLSAALVTLHAFFPEEIDLAWSRLSHAVATSSIDTTLLAFAGAYLYVVGVFVENISRITFEWRLNQVKEERQRNLHQGVSYGNMRFTVMAKNSLMYIEVDSQLKRMRTERVLALCQVILIPAALHSILHHPTSLTITLTVILMISLCLTLMQVDQRFNRYCRAIERGYIETQRGTLSGSIAESTNLTATLAKAPHKKRKTTHLPDDSQASKKGE